MLKKKICIIDPSAPCDSCEIKGYLICDVGDRKRTWHFYTSLGSVIFTALLVLAISAYFTGHWWTIPAYISFWAVYQLYAELVIHCPHCPYWDEDADEICCLPNCGIKKPRWKWIRKHLKHNPKPYNNLEKLILNTFNISSLAFPFVVGSFTINSSFHWMHISSLSLCLVSTIYFIHMLNSHFCRKCANFSCPNNRVSKEVVEIFLAKNPCWGNIWKCNDNSSGNR